MIRIDIKTTDLRQVPFTYKNGPKAGKPGLMHKQEAWAHTFDDSGKPHPYPQRISIDIDVEHQQAAWPVGSYQVSPSSLYVGKYGDLVLGRLVLSPLAQTIKQAA